ncbi:MAG: hypothetical protein KZQ90_05860 [Candidatus Thiodiazotropha sp. (ex Codakia rugifera)]|nr:hypothetical protein [Candidatus Thiodiazotropha sp. (ex Codakia rugifera)]
MNRLYLVSRIKVYVTIFTFLHLFSVLSVFMLDGYRHWLWLFPALTVLVTLIILHRIKKPFYVLQRIDDILTEMLEGKFSSRITKVPWMGEAGMIAWNLNESLDQLETFFREVCVSFEAVSKGCYYRSTQPVGLHGALKETLQRINSSLDAMADNAIYVRRNEMAAELQQLNTNQTMENLHLSQNDLSRITSEMETVSQIATDNMQ